MKGLNYQKSFKNTLFPKNIIDSNAMLGNYKFINLKESTKSDKSCNKYSENNKIKKDKN